MTGEAARKVQAWVWECRCTRCSWTWFAFARPKWCAGCKSRWWDKPRVRKRVQKARKRTPREPTA